MYFILGKYPALINSATFRWPEGYSTDAGDIHASSTFGKPHSWKTHQKEQQQQQLQSL